MRASTLERAVRILGDETSEFGGSTGGQVAVHVIEDSLRHTSTGHTTPGDEMQCATVHNVWCATKPIVASALLHRLWSAGLADRPIKDLLHPDTARILPDAVGAHTAGEILNHTAGLVEPSSYQAMFIKPEQRVAAVLEGSRRAATRPSYGEYAPIKLVELGVENALGFAPLAAVTGWIDRYLRWPDEVSFRPDVPDRRTIGPYVLRRPGQPPTFAYHDRSVRSTSLDRLALGGFVSVRGLADFYSLFIIGGPLEESFVTWLFDHRAVSVIDASLDIEATYRAGFLEWEGTLGHPGLSGSSFGFVSCDRRVAGAYMVNGLFSSRQDIDFLRSRMIKALTDER